MPHSTRRHFIFGGAALAAGSTVRPAQAASATLPATNQPDFTFLCIGQSNMDGTNALPPSPLLLPGAREEHVSWCYYKDRQWGVLQDPYGGGTAFYSQFTNPYAGASVVPGIARRLMPQVGNLAVIPMAKGGTVIGSWLFRPTGGTSYLDKAVLQTQASGQNPHLALWWQGESDAGGTTTGAAYKGYLARIADRVFAEFGCPLMVGVIEDCYAPAYQNLGVIQQAQRESWADVPHVVQGPDLSDIPCMPEDTVHLARASKIDAAAERWAAAILAWRASVQ